MPKKISWTYGKKRYYGTFIRETKTHKFARTSNGKIKKIKQQQDTGLVRNGRRIDGDSSNILYT